MAARSHESLQKSLTRPFIVAAGQTVVAGRAVRFAAADTDVQHAVATENPIGIALEGGAAGETVQVALLTGTAIIPVIVGTGGATRGSYCECVADGLTNRTLGGGTVVRYIAGKFLQTGVAGDIVGMMPNSFAGVSV